VGFNLADLFEMVVDAVPDEEAVVVGARRLSYAALEERINRLAHHFAASGIGPGDAVGLQLTNGSEYLEAMFAAFKIRAVPVNVNFRYVADELRFLYRDAGLVGLVYDRRFSAAVADAFPTIVEQRAVLAVGDGAEGTEVPGSVGYEHALEAASPARDFGSRSADDLYCVYTGGTTGLPKGVLWRQEDIFFAAMGGGDLLHTGNPITSPSELVSRVMTPGLVALPTPPLMHASAHWLACSVLFAGGKVVMAPSGHFDPAETWRLVTDEGVHILVVVGDAMARPLVDELDAHGSRYDFSTLIVIGSGGAILSPSTKERLAALLPGRMIVDGFGASETGQIQVAASAEPMATPRLAVDGHTTVFDDALQPLVAGSGRSGHLARSGHIPLGYLGDPEKTAATFPEVGGIRWVLPGDTATIEVDGTITVLGRGTLSINTGGEKVYPEEVEAALKGHPDVMDAIVVGLPDERWGERVVALVEPRSDRAPEPESLEESCRAHLAPYKVPRTFLFTDRIERAPSGKADYRWARARAAELTKEVAGAGE